MIWLISYFLLSLVIYAVLRYRTKTNVFKDDHVMICLLWPVLLLGNAAFLLVSLPFKIVDFLVDAIRIRRNMK